MAVYFIRSGGPDGFIKIGVTSGRVEARLSSLQTGNPHKLTVLATIDGGPEVELKLHRRFAAFRVDGEWFRAAPELLAFIDGIVASASVRVGAPENLNALGFTKAQMHLLWFAMRLREVHESARKILDSYPYERRAWRADSMDHRDQAVAKELLDSIEYWQRENGQFFLQATELLPLSVDPRYVADALRLLLGLRTPEPWELDDPAETAGPEVN